MKLDVSFSGATIWCQSGVDVHFTGMNRSGASYGRHVFRYNILKTAFVFSSIL